MASTESSEAARERELFKYYQPPLPSEQVGGIAQPLSSHDATLTAFAQLGAQRLNTKRGLISLVARDTQYIIAEATRTLSLQPSAVFEGDDTLWKGVTIVRRSDGPCSVAMDLFTGRIVGERTHLVVNDLSKDDRFSKMDPVAQSPFMKFYVTVPLHSPAGFTVGAFCIVDDKPRDGLSEADMAFMKDMSRIIMAHLEAGRVKQQHRRAERMIRGLGLFVEGKNSLRDWWLSYGHKTEEEEVNYRIRHGESLNSQADHQFGVQESSGSLAQAAVRAIQPSSRRILSRPRDGRDDDSNSATLSVIHSDSHDTAFTNEQYASNLASTLETSHSAYEPAHDDVEQAPKPLEDSLETNSGAQLQDAILSDDIRETFSRASNLIRESIGVEGALFLDASVGTFGGSSTKANMSNNAPTAWNNQSTPFVTSSSDEAHNRSHGSKSSTTQSSSQKSCGILGYSTAARSSLSMHQAYEHHLTVSESFLRRLIMRYPHGKVFNFDDEGFLSNSEGEFGKALQTAFSSTAAENSRASNVGPQRKQKRKTMSKEAEAKAILQILPHARCVAFFPLWDSHKERWFAGSFVWTTNVTRILDPDEDLTYLASFSNSIMFEVSRLEALVNSQMKISFISSISHELRSPLHGVLASAEFLKDSVLDHPQHDMVDTINSCGRTLLDTINHVLDFSKIRSTSTARGKESRNSNRKSRRHKFPSDKSSHQASAVDMSIITEEVIEAVYASHKLNRGTLIDSYKQESAMENINSSTRTYSAQSLVVIVDTAWRQDWKFCIDPGAWRRLVMNIFGNALKYTEAGFVRVSLGSRNDTKSIDDVSTSTIVLTVTDSGKGISKEFLNHHLYTPFAQEDSLAMGTGLGLSIVRNIVSELGGSINVTSEQGWGTEVKVSVPLSTSRLSPPLHPNNRQDGMVQIQKKTRGLKACLVGFNIVPDIVDEPTGILSVEAERMFSLKDSLTLLMDEWFGMKVVVASTLDLSIATVFCVMQSTFQDIIASGWLETGPTQSKSTKPILLVLCSRRSHSLSSTNNKFCDIVYLQQPIGPRKLAKALSRCLVPEHASQIESYISNIDGAGPFTHQECTSDVEVDEDSEVTSPFAQFPDSKQPVFPTRIQENVREASAIPVQLPKANTSKPADQGILTTNPPKSGFTSSLHQDSAHNVLLVEDNATNLKLLVAYMRKLGVEHNTAENGLIAVRKYKASPRPFDFIFIDISMPVMDGLEASREIRLFERESKRPRAVIVAITGASSQDARQEAFSAGIDQFLIKPVPMKVLKQILEDTVVPRRASEP